MSVKNDVKQVEAWIKVSLKEYCVAVLKGNDPLLNDIEDYLVRAGYSGTVAHQIVRSTIQQIAYNYIITHWEK